MTILNQVDIMTIPWYVDWIIWGGFSILVLSLLAFIITLDCGYNFFVPSIGLIVGAVLFIIGLEMNDNPTIDTDRNRYEVIIEDPEVLVDMYDNYNIIEHRGQIWVIEDKEETK